MSLLAGETGWFSIPAGRPFLDDLAARLHRTLGPGGGDVLDQSVILLPNRRGARALAQAFVRASDRPALLLPQIRALGDLEEGEAPFEPGDLVLDLAPAISPWRRRFELARLTHGHMNALGRELDPAATFQLADALGGFFDSLEIEEITDRDKIAALVEGDLADHWRQSAEFLALAVRDWPERLAQIGLADPASRRVTLLRRLAEKWEGAPPAYPVVAAGSTGSVPATAALLNTIARLPKGCVVLPGLDTSLATEAWDAIEPQHSQFALKRLLSLAEIELGDVRPWNPTVESDNRWRRRALNEALRPAKVTGDWLKQIDDLKREALAAGVAENPIAVGLDGLRVIAARAEEEAASAAAILLRETLETPGKTAALITPDQAFARRVSARMARWGVVVDVSAGTPLADTQVGVLMSLIARLFADPEDPVTLLALLKHPFVRLGLEDAERGRGRDELERWALRGPRPRGWSQIFARLTKAERGEGFARRLADLLAPAGDLFAAGEVSPRDAARALAGMAEALARGPDGDVGGLWSGPAGEAAAGLISALIEDGGLLEPVGAGRFERLIEHLLGGETVRPTLAVHPRLQILGALEARLVHADRVILAGLEEGVWPPAAPTDPFLSRPMRGDIGLPSPERRIGLSAHDFVQLASSPEVYLIHTARRGGQPAVKSRWLWRLETLAGGAGLNGLPRRPEILEWAKRLDEAEPLPPMTRPAPCPPLADRPRELSVTQVETLTRDPYAIWARHILRLKALDRPDKEADALARGSAIHKAFEKFATFWPTALPPNAADEFCKLYLAQLLEAGMPASAMAREEALATEAAAWVVAWEAERRADDPQILVETDGATSFQTGRGPFTLKARADRIEIGPNGIGHVIDFKTGSAPTGRQLTTGFSPQLTLTAAILLRGGFAAASAASIGELLYVQVTGRKPAGKVIDPLKKEVTIEVVEAAWRGLQDLIAHYDQPRSTYPSRTAPQFVSSYASDYDHLARVFEWSIAGGDGEGE